MKMNMRRKGSERKQRSAGRKKGNRRRHSSPTTQAVTTIPHSETNSPNVASPGEREFSEETSIPRMMQSGGLQGTAGTKAVMSESIAELFAEGEELESEVVQGVEDAPDADQGEIETHEASREEAPEYKNRNRI
jgi:hypothetical protein